jgi:hypothetical protein
MTRIGLLCIVLVISCWDVVAQHPLIGTWKMISVKGINAEGEKFYRDTTTIREIKIITPTHYMLIAEDVSHDSLVFNRCYGGTIQLEGKNYEEIPELSSTPLFDNVKTDYTWKVEGDKFTQAGTFTRPDGKKVILEAMIFQKVKSKKPSDSNPAIGTWKLLSANYTGVDGTKGSYTSETTQCLQLITPTHWMYISRRNSKLESAMGGTYVASGDKFLLNLDHASFPKKSLGKLEITQKIEGDKLTINGVSTYADGRNLTWEDVFTKVK